MYSCLVGACRHGHRTFVNPRQKQPQPTTTNHNHQQPTATNSNKQPTTTNHHHHYHTRSGSSFSQSDSQDKGRLLVTLGSLVPFLGHLEVVLESSNPLDDGRCVGPRIRGSGCWRVRCCLNLDHFSARWTKRSTCDTAWVTPGSAYLGLCENGQDAAVRQQTKPSVWHEVRRLSSRVSPWYAKEEVPSGVNLNPYAGSGSSIPPHCDDTLGQVQGVSSREAEFSLFALDFLAQSEYEKSTSSELQSPEVNLFRWIGHDKPSCPLARGIYKEV